MGAWHLKRGDDLYGSVRGAGRSWLPFMPQDFSIYVFSFSWAHPLWAYPPRACCSRNRTNTNPNGTEANPAGRSVSACVARESKRKRERRYRWACVVLFFLFLPPLLRLPSPPSGFCFFFSSLSSRSNYQQPWPPVFRDEVSFLLSCGWLVCGAQERERWCRKAKSRGSPASNHNLNE